MVDQQHQPSSIILEVCNLFLIYDIHLSSIIYIEVFVFNNVAYIADCGNHVIRKVTFSDGNIATFAGTLRSAGYSGDGGAATSAKLNSPRGFVLY